jgi:uncharacterized protein (DUF4415 family)
MRKVHSKPLSAKLRAELQTIAELSEEAIGTREMPEVEDWSGARRGALFRPAKRQVTLRLDADVVDWFRSRSSRARDCQADINQALREYIARHAHKTEAG